MAKTLRNLDHRAIIAALRTIGEDKNVRQKYIAKRMRREESWVSKVLTGETMLSSPEFMGWARVLKMTPTELMNVVEQMRKVLR